MKKMTILIAATTLAIMSSGAFAHGGGDWNKMGGSDGKPNYCKSKQMHNHEGGSKWGKKSCRKDKHRDWDKNMSPEKRQALMQLKVENKIERMTKKYDLTESQQSKLRTILQDKQQKKMKLKEETRSKIESMLTPEQQEMFQHKHK